MNSNFVVEILKYFAKYPAKTAVQKYFSRKTEKVPGYNTLRNYVEALPSPGLFPEIETFIFTTDSTKLENYVRNGKGYIMIIEFGQLVASAPNDMKSVDVDWYFAVTIARAADPANTDAIEEAIISSTSLDLCVNILKQMRLDDVEICHKRQYLESDVVLSPVEPVMLLNNVGWTFTFKKNLDNIF